MQTWGFGALFELMLPHMLEIVTIVATAIGLAVFLANPVAQEDESYLIATEDMAR
jgi:hypothetical protein